MYQLLDQIVWLACGSTKTGLEVSSLDCNNFYPLPEVLTQQKMPGSTDNLITSEDLAKFPYL